MMKYSLHIGLNCVDPFVYGGWSGLLSGCRADAEAMAKIAFIIGARINILYDKEATIQSVVDAIYLLTQDAQPGDTVFITYSGHGGQAFDYNGDEKDGMDETWVLYDGMLIDDDINQLLAQFKRGVKVIILSDSCHSGTVTKAQLLFDADWKQGYAPKAAPEYACRVAPLSSAPLTRALAKKPRQKASIILISGCADNQLSYDGPQNGLFTSTLLKVYDGGRYKGTYKEFRKAIVLLMPPGQTPQITITGGSNKTFAAGPVLQ